MVLFGILWYFQVLVLVLFGTLLYFFCENYTLARKEMELSVTIKNF